MSERICDLDGPPTVGKLYLVPAVLMARFFGKPEIWWPVVGPMHTDVEFFNFQRPHYHVDVRFLTTRHRRQIGGGNRFTDCPFGAALAVPVSASYALNSPDAPPPPEPVLRGMQCRRLGVAYPYAKTVQVAALNEAYRHDRARRNAAGHLICPHRGARIDQLPPDANGIVTCPLHGLRINLRTGACVP